MSDPCTSSRETELDEYLRTRRSQIDDALEHLLSTQPECPPLIVDAMRYSLFAGGKRLRPILTLATADTLAAGGHGEPELALPAACAVEMIHTYSLIHDDLPAMDNDTLRRGRPTAHVIYGEGVAILAGDGLLTEAFRVMALHPHTEDPTVVTRKLQAIERMAAAAGAAGMVGGQAIDLQAAGQVLDHARPVMNLEGLRSMHERKTGALIRAAVVVGATMVGASPPTLDAVDEYATRLGLGFQIVDDLLDVEGAADTMGKTTGKDAAAGKPTYPSIVGIEQSRILAARAISEAKTTLSRVGLGGRLDEIADWVLARTY